MDRPSQLEQPQRAKGTLYRSTCRSLNAPTGMKSGAKWVSFFIYLHPQLADVLFRSLSFLVARLWAWLDLTRHTTLKWRQLGISVTVKVCLHLAIVTLLLIVLISSPTRPESIFGLAFNLGRAHQRVQRWLWIAPTIHREERCTAPIPPDRSINDGFPNISAKYQQGLRVI